MKMKWSVSVLALVLLLCTTASAAVQDFPKFKIDVPDDWSTSQSGPTIILLANDRSASISITIAPTEGVPLEQLAKAFSQELKGSAPAAGSGGFEFSFKAGEAESQALILENPDSKEYVLIAVTGQNPKIPDIINSLQDK